MLEHIDLDLRILPGPPGWASCSVRTGAQAVSIGEFSHALTDGIDDLLRATVGIACDEWREATFSMDAEPEPRWQWFLKQELRGYGPARGPELDVIITRIDDIVTGAGEEVLRATCDPDQFGRAVLSAMQRAMSSEPREQLLRRWRRFPARAVAALEAALTIPPEVVIL